MNANNANSARTELLAFTAAAIATMGVCAQWDRAVSAYLTAQTLCDADGQYGKYRKAADAAAELRVGIEERFGAGYRTVPDAQDELQAMHGELDAATSEWSARFCDEQDAAAFALVATPAPSLAAAVFKHNLIAREELHQAEALQIDCMEALAADFARLNSDRTGEEWAAACQAEQAAREKARQFHADHVAPITIAHSAGEARLADAYAQEEAAAPLYSAHAEAINAMLMVPAPSLAAVLHKLRVGLNDWAFDGSSEGCAALEQIADDLARLSGEA